MKRDDFRRDATLTDAWRKLGVPTTSRGQATRWHDKQSAVWTLWIENPNGVSFEALDKGDTLILTPWEVDEESLSSIHKGKVRSYWIDLREAAGERKVIRIMAIKWRRDANGRFVDDPNGATVPVYWREMGSEMHEDGYRVVLREPSTPR